MPLTLFDDERIDDAHTSSASPCPLCHVTPIYVITAEDGEPEILTLKCPECGLYMSISDDFVHNTETGRSLADNEWDRLAKIVDVKRSRSVEELFIRCSFGEAISISYMNQIAVWTGKTWVDLEVFRANYGGKETALFQYRDGICWLRECAGEE